MGKCYTCREVTIAQVRRAVKEAYEETKAIEGGKNASYIPFLAEADPDLFGLCVCLPDGSLVKAGDTEAVFGIESVSKVPTAILAMRQHGAEGVLKKIGANATGLPFNSIMAILLENDSPSTPLVNAGAIAACSMVKPKGDAEAKWGAITDNLAELAGSPLVLLDKLYASEAATDYNNRSIAWLLKNYGRIFDDPEMSLDLYTRQCSMGITCEQMAIMAGTIAADGYNPVTDTQVFDPDLAPKVVSLVTTVGFYQNTGNWLFEAGIPAKSGVGGGILGVMPGLFGIAAFSPPLDEAGNSVKAQAAIKAVMRKLDLNIFSGKRICQLTT